jgi:hypothetical protein
VARLGPQVQLELAANPVGALVAPFDKIPMGTTKNAPSEVHTSDDVVASTGFVWSHMFLVGLIFNKGNLRQ